MAAKKVKLAALPERRESPRPRSGGRAGASLLTGVAVHAGFVLLVSSLVIIPQAGKSLFEPLLFESATAPEPPMQDQESPDHAPAALPDFPAPGISPGSVPEVSVNFDNVNPPLANEISTDVFGADWPTKPEVTQKKPAPPAARATKKPVAKKSTPPVAKVEPKPVVRKKSLAAPVRPKYTPKPSYPSAARSRKQSGTAMVKLSVSSSGKVASASIVRSSGHSSLDSAAVKATRRWKFSPARDSNGNARSSSVVVPISFAL